MNPYVPISRLADASDQPRPPRAESAANSTRNAFMP